MRINKDKIRNTNTAKATDTHAHLYTHLYTHIPLSSLNVVTPVDLIELLFCKESLIRISSL